MADNSTGILTRRGKRNHPKPSHVKKRKIRPRGQKMTKPPPTLPPSQLLPPPLPPSFSLSPSLLLLPPPLPLPPLPLSTKSNACSWAKKGPCQFANLGPPPEPCQHEGCSLTVHHVCQNLWEENHNLTLQLISRYCPHHHHGYGSGGMSPKILL